MENSLGKDLELAFTEHVLTFEAAIDGPDPALEKAWRKLDSLLRRELKQRHLWDMPPHRLGVLAMDHWRQPDAFEELLTDLYVAAILVPLNSLEALARVSGNVEGAVVRNLRSFFTWRQRKNDPLGARAYEMLCRAVQMMIDTNELFLLHGGSPLCGSTVLSFVQEADPAGAWRQELEEVEEWVPVLLPELITATHPGEARRLMLERLVEFLRGLSREELVVFELSVVLLPLRRATRQTWFRVEDSESLEDSQAPDPGAGLAVLRFEERQFFLLLADCITESLTGLARTAKTLAHLERLWFFLRTWALEPDEPLPSRRGLSEHLEIPRPTLMQLLEALGEQLEDCRRQVRQDPGQDPSEEP